MAPRETDTVSEQELLKRVLLQAHLKPIHLAITTFLACISALFEGVSLLLLLPTVRGVINQMNFSFVRQTSLGKMILDVFPDLPLTSAAFFGILIGSIVTAVLLKNIFAYLAAFYAIKHIRNFSARLRQLIFSRYLSFGKLFFDRTNQGYLTDILTSFVQQFSAQLVRLHMALVNSVFFILYLGALFLLFWQLTFFIIVFFPIAYYGLRIIIEKIKKSSRESIVVTRTLSERIFNTLSCIPLIKVYANQEAEKASFARISNNVARAEFNIDKKAQLLGPLQETASTIGIVFLIGAIAYLVNHNVKKNVENFLLYFFIVKKMVGSMRPISEIWGLLASIKGHITETLGVFNDKDKFFVPDGTREFPGLKNNIEFRHLSFTYTKNSEILSDITFNIAKGTTLAIVGPTGTGKTTLISLLLRFYDCPPSTIFIDGVDIREYSLRTLMDHFALVSQDALLFNDTLRANIAYGLKQKVSDEQLLEALGKAKLQEFMSKLPQGLDTLIGDKGIRLSGGERQRVSLARALLKGAEILILDEATSSLDSKTEQFIQAAIEEAIKEKTVIVIAHRLSTVKNAHHIVVIENGRLVEEGSLDSLLAKKGSFSGYWEAQKFY